MRKGQFFTIGLILLAIMILVVVGLQGRAFLTADPDPHTRDFFEKGIEEVPYLIDNSLSQNYSSRKVEENIEGYMNFLMTVNSGKGIGASYVSMVGIENDDGDFDIVVGNYLEGMNEINITVDGSIEETIYFDSGEYTETVVLNLDQGTDEIGLLFEEGFETVDFKDRPFYIVYGRNEMFNEVWIKTEKSG